MSDFMDDIGMPAVGAEPPQAEQQTNHNTQNYWASQAPASSQNGAINLTKGSEQASSTVSAQPSGYGSRPSDYGASATASSTQPSGYGSRPNDYGASTTASSTQPSGYGTRPNDYGASATASSTQPSGYGTRPNDYGASATSSTQPSGYNTAASTQSNGYGTRSSDYGSSYNSSSGMNSGFDSSSSFGSSFAVSQGSPVLSLVFGVIGAMVGAIPGFLLLLFLGKIGYVAALSGAVLAGGAFFGYGLATSKNDAPDSAGLIICVIVCIIAVYLGVRICWCWDMVDTLNDYLPTFEAEARALADDSESGTELAKLAKEMLFSQLGISDVSYSSISAHFSTILDKTECKGKFVKDLLLSYLFAFAGGIGIFTKTK